MVSSLQVIDALLLVVNGLFKFSYQINNFFVCFVFCSAKHLSGNIRKVGVVADVDTECLEAGHSWLNGVLIHGTNSIPGQRMLQAMDHKTTLEGTAAEYQDIEDYRELIVVRRVRSKQVRQVTTRKRVQKILTEIEHARQNTDNADDFCELLQNVKKEQRGPKKKKTKVQISSSSSSSSSSSTS